MKQPINIQDQFLNQLRRENIGLRHHILNQRFSNRGLCRGFDNFTVLFESDGKQQLVFKHAISTFSPSRNVQIELE